MTNHLETERRTDPQRFRRDFGGHGPRLEARHNAGLTLIELIGVLAIIAIIALVAMSSVIRRIDQAQRDRETSDLNTLSHALVQSAKSEKRLPAVGTMASVIANYRGLALSQVTTNARGFGRTFIVKADIGGNDLQSTTYLQSNTNATTRPTSARVMFLSTLASPALPSINATNFDNIWNTPEGAVPAALAGRDPFDLKIQRLDLANLFYCVRLHNMDTKLAPYTFNTNPIATIPNISTRTLYVLQDSALNLYGATTNLQLRDIIIEDESFVFQNGSWSRDLTSPKISPTVGPYGSLVAQFLDVGPPTDPSFGASPQATIETFFNYMLEYILWSRGDPIHGIPAWQGAGAPNNIPQYPYFSRMQDAQQQLFDASNNLIK